MNEGQTFLDSSDDEPPQKNVFLKAKELLKKPRKASEAVDTIQDASLEIDKLPIAISNLLRLISKVQTTLEARATEHDEVVVEWMSKIGLLLQNVTDEVVAVRDVQKDIELKLGQILNKLDDDEESSDDSDILDEEHFLG